MAGAANETISFSGKLKALEQFDLVDGSVAFLRPQAVGYQRTGSGPILLRLNGFRPFHRRVSLLDGSDEDANEKKTEMAVEELHAKDSEFD